MSNKEMLGRFIVKDVTVRVGDKGKPFMSWGCFDKDCNKLVYVTVWDGNLSVPNDIESLKGCMAECLVQLGQPYQSTSDQKWYSRVELVPFSPVVVTKPDGSTWRDALEPTVDRYVPQGDGRLRAI